MIISPRCFIAFRWGFQSIATKSSLSAVMVVCWERKSTTDTYSLMTSASWLVSFLKEQ